MVEAERRLLPNALLDFSNQRFVLVSESCIPIFPFSVVYYLINSSQSFVEIYVDLRYHRYINQMFPVIKRRQWRKGSQQFETDRKYFREFAKGRRPRCADEYYIPTMVNIEFGAWNSNRSLLSVRTGVRDTSVCYLFARKFPPNALDRLMNL